MKIFPTLVSLALAMVLAGPTSLYAQDAGATKQEQKQEPKKEEPKKDPKVEEYEKAIKDLKRLDGEFTLYQRKKEILLELAEKDLNRIFLMQATFGTGASTDSVQAGDPVGSFEAQPFRFEKRDESVWLIRPNVKYRWDENDPLALASQRSLPHAILGSFRIEQTNPEKKLYLVNVTQLFYGDAIRINDVVNSGVGGSYMLDREKSGPASVKSFAENAVVKMDLHYMSQRGQEMNPLLVLLGLGGQSHLEDGRSLPLSVTYNFWFRKDTGYKPRVADPRVGYFTSDYYDLDKFLEEDRTERYIWRFNLVKKDPTAALSEPVKPIVWVIDNSVPKEYRQACKEGILRWNKAFEKIGFKNAVIVKDQPNDPDYDHADGRYNVFRWTMSPDAGYAIALTRTDPFTGEVLNAGVTMDANMLQFSQQEQAGVGVPTVEAYKRANSVLLRNPNHPQNLGNFLFGRMTEEQLVAANEMAAKYGWNLSKCSYGEGKRESAGFAWYTLEASGATLAISREDYARQFISDVVSHEVGHTLGLRHNFVSSTHLTTHDLASDEITGRESISASVMDYTPVNILAILKGKGNFYSPAIGRYDYWAIEYGYKPINGNIGDRPVLGSIAGKSTQPGLAYMTDENADAWNPYVVRFDAAKDPLAYSSKLIEAAKRIRKYAIDKLPNKGESYAKRTKLIMYSINSTFREGRYSARFVGGVVGNRNYFNGKNAVTLTPVDSATQRAAIQLIAKECLSPLAFNLPQDVLMNMSMDANSPESFSWTAPVRDQIGMQQSMLLSMLMAASTTDRITENQFKWGEKPGTFTVAEHYSTLRNAVFGELGTGKKISPTRRDLQRYMLNGLITQAGSPQGSVSEDVRMVAGESLRKLSASMGTDLKTKKLDNLTKIHLRDSKETIDRFLARSFAVNR